jgi:hypothetical protein
LQKYSERFINASFNNSLAGFLIVLDYKPIQFFAQKSYAERKKAEKIEGKKIGQSKRKFFR